MNNSNIIRILIVDDSEQIHRDFYKVLMENSADDTIIDEDEAALFSTKPHFSEMNEISYLIDSALQGQDALQHVEKSIACRKPYALAFVDIRMPPGWDGIETIKQLWRVDPEIQIVICSAYSEYAWEDIIKALGKTDNLIILKKPFEVIEIRQLALALTQKWILKQQVNFQIEYLNTQVEDRTIELRNSLSIINAAIEVTSDAIIVLSKDKKIVKYNNKFLTLWDLSESVMKSESAEHIFQKMANQVKNPSAFLKMINDMRVQPNDITIKEWRLKSKRVLEHYQHPHTIHNVVMGMIYSFRDITRQKYKIDELH